MERPVWLEINLDNIGYNVRELKKLIAPGVKMMAVVKADGYGHGAIQIADAALKNGAEQLAVAILNEGLQLRKAGFGVPILILGYTPPEQAAEVVKNNLTQTVYTLEDARVLSWAAVQQRKTARIHIKIDTGMSRLGFLPGPESVNQIVEISKLPNLNVEGIFTHFADADNSDKSYTEQQFMLFKNMLFQLTQHGVEIPVRHCANSAAIIDLPQTHLDMVRAGISMYGYYPSDLVDKTRVKLKPAFTLKARIAHVKTVPSDTSISYGRIFTTSKTSQIATIPIGYADGYPRAMANRGQMLVHGQQVPVVGRVCMDQCMVDVSELSGVQAGDEVVIIGVQEEQLLPVETFAEAIDTINYEVLCMISQRVPRTYI